jgi:hypothetical protein
VEQPPSSPNLTEPFAHIFTDRAEAEWAFDLLRDTAKRLGIQGAYDARFALTLVQQAGRLGLHLNFGGWLVLGFHGLGTPPKDLTGTLRENLSGLPYRVDLALLAERVAWDERLSSFPFEPKEGEPEVRSYHLPLAMIRPMTSDLAAAYEATLDFITQKFQHWQRAAHWKQHRPELAEALFKPEQRQRVLAGLLNEPELRYERHLTAFYQDVSEEREEYEVGEAEVEAKAEEVKEIKETLSWLQKEDKMLLDEQKESSIQYWKIAPGENAWQWDECCEGNFIAIGWEEIGDVSNMSKEEFDQRLTELGWSGTGADQVWRFTHIAEGDQIVANRGMREILGVGTVIGPYYFVRDIRHGHRLPVRWDDLTLRQINEPGWRRTLVPLSREKFETLCKIPSTTIMSDVISPESTVHKANYPLAQLVEDTGLDEAELARWLRAIERKGQAILYGPPGTGKTFIAEKLARHLTGGGDGFWELVQFHPAYAYEDFVQGIRPHSDAAGLSYPLLPGRFLEFCAQAQTRQDRCVLIIDEINRANLSRVFGELMYLLEYRDRAIPLAGGGLFQIPANVRLLGTMNTADRSIALVDHALRRRFAFIALYPNYELLRGYHQRHLTGFPIENLIAVLKNLNQAIGDRHYEVGVTFFLHPQLTEEIEDIWRMEIEPYLEEYFFDQADQVARFRWESVKSSVLG